MEETAGSDRELGLMVLFVVLGLVGALAMYVTSVGGNQVLSGWGFAGALVAGVLAIAAVHVYD